LQELLIFQLIVLKAKAKEPAGGLHQAEGSVLS